SQLLNAKYL
nr:Chain C, GAP50 peptide [Plasmodium berghei]5WLG_H Chain H, GAP50 peptide [Plasmodium berghei]5WLI_C Chain C, GAP50 peptide [Plasmodium berghei]5WLI_F Chain F, GAP50 peptide [Plasmodium berghei]5WLI_I Chain I, GAP50 peptide [Plasmodium berghei]5WLI_L Chain L, GAP50 peptide [Plasmodium berghei]